MAAPTRVAAVLDQHNDWVESFVGGFQTELQGMVSAAEARTLAQLRDSLTFYRGRIGRSAANQRVLRQVDDMLTRAMSRAGYDKLVDEFVQGFAGQLPYFDDVLQAISENLDRPLKAALTKADQSLLASQQISTVENLQTVVEGAAALAKRKALMSVGALPFSELAVQISQTFSRALPEAVTLAETSTTMFFRTATDRGFAKIEAGLAPGAVRYQYEGPRDKLTRPFCQRMLTRTREKPLTREKIEGADNGQIPNPFVSAGGYNCRHQWVITEIRDGK